MEKSRKTRIVKSPNNTENVKKLNKTKASVIPKKNESVKKSEKTKSLCEVGRTQLFGKTDNTEKEFKERVTFAAKKEKQVMQELKKEMNGISIFEGLSAELREQKIPDGWAGQIFAKIDSKIHQEYGGSCRFLAELRQAGIDYFKDNIEVKFNITSYEAISNDDLPDVMQKVEDEISRLDTEGIKLFDTDSERYKFAALKKIYRNLNNEFAKRKKAVERRKQIETEVTDNSATGKLTNRQWTIAMRFFIDVYRLGKIDTINFARLLTVLNNGKNLQGFRTGLSGRRDLITDQTRNDAQMIADLCDENGLSKVAEYIKDATARVKT